MGSNSVAGTPGAVAHQPGRDRPALALGLRLVAAFDSAALFTFVKLAGDHNIALAQVMFWRFLMSVPVVLGFLALRGELASLRTSRLRAHFLRGLNSTGSMVLNFGAAMMLPLAVTTTLNFTTPLFAVLIAALFLREKVSGWHWLAVGLGFAGVILVAQPTPGEAVSHLGAAAGLAAAAIVATTNMQVRDLARTEPSLTIVFYFSLFGTLLAACALPFFPVPTSPVQWGLLLGVGLCGLVYQVFMALSLRFGSVSNVLVMDYSALIWATLLGWLIWDKLPPVLAWLGAPLIIGAGLTIAWRTHRDQRLTAAIPANAD